jgi:hypothetical protein
MHPMEKHCIRCKHDKGISEYYKSSNNLDGLASYCKQCHSELMKAVRSKNAEYYRKYGDEWKLKNKEHIKEVNKAWYQNNKEKRLESTYKWRRENPEKHRSINNKSQNKRLRTPMGKLNNSFHVAIYKTLKSGKGHRRWCDIVGYTAEQLKCQLEKKFKPGMTWENYGKWHIDHKIPVSVFNFEKPEDMDFKKCWGLNNLQPMWAKENMVKHAKIDRPFQPSLALSV